MRGIGTLTNVFTIVGGTLVGLIVGRYISERIRLTVEQAVGMTTLVLGIATAAKTDNIVFPLVSVVLGGVIGESLRIEDRFESLGNWVRHKVEVKSQSGWISRTSLTTLHPRFVEGFVTATLLFSIGPMSILGSIDDGLGRGAQILIVKAALDGLVSVLFAATMGWGVAISAIIVGIYQGLMTLGASGLDAILTDRMVHEMSATGGIMILGIALRFMEVKPIRVGSLLPGLFVAPVLVALFAR